jgi:hypothetical protein
MILNDYASLSTAQLLEVFSKAARQIGLGSDFWNMSSRSREPSKPMNVPDAQPPDLEQNVVAVYSAARALRARGATAEIRNLFDGDPDVRFQAARLFEDIDPEAAAAADRSLSAQLPTRDVIALRRRARQTPRERPTLHEMSDDALVARFEDAAARLGGAQYLDPIDEPEDQETQNRIGREIIHILRAMKARSLLSRLLPLLSSPDFTIRCRAAEGCLRLAEGPAVAALQSVIAGGKSDEVFAARDLLDCWRKGRCLVDGL